MSYQGDTDMSKLIKDIFSKVALLNIRNRFVGFEVDKNPFGETVDLSNDQK